LNVLYNFGTAVTVDITLYAKWSEFTDEDIEDFGPDATIRDIFTVSNLDEWNVAKTAISEGGNGTASNNINYVITVIDSFTVPGSTANTFAPATNIKVSLRGDGTLTLTSNGNLIRMAGNHTVILRDLTLKGHSGNNGPLVYVLGTFIMQSGTITGNTNSTASSGGGGVLVSSSRTFTMYGGVISDNTGKSGGGVYLYGGTLTMHGGEISGNTSTGSGGGVEILNGTFDMYNGTISGNTAITQGGGVYSYSGTFTMHDGTISGNTGDRGGGVNVGGGTSTMRGGEISGNTANNSTYGGGGVYVAAAGTFRLVTGTIYGSSNPADPSLRNTANTGAALYMYSGATAQRGTFAANGTTWNSNANLTTNNNTIRVVEGVLQ
jgi:hypothetical protein